MTSSADGLEAHVGSFLLELFDTFRGSVPNIPDNFFRVLIDGQKRNIAIRLRDPAGLPLTVDAVPLLFLGVSFRCVWDTGGQYLAIERSSLSLSTHDATEPLVRYDYLREPSASVPASHINVHAHRDELVFALVAAGLKDRGLLRSRAIDAGRMPRMSSLHLPVGGHRFRPSVEDLLELAIVEFGVDRIDTFREALDAGRIRYRRRQLMAAVRDDPESAAVELRELGYAVTGDGTPRQARSDRIAQW